MRAGDAEDAADANELRPLQQPRQLGDVDGNPPRHVAREPMHYSTAAFSSSKFTYLPIGVADAEAFGRLMDLPGGGKRRGSVIVSYSAAAAATVPASASAAEGSV